MHLPSLKKCIHIACLLFLGFAAKAQELRLVTFSQGTTFAYFTFITDREVQIRVSEDGKIMAYGIEQQSIRDNNYYSPKLQPYVGPVEYYGPEADSAYRGKIRRIGSSAISYYSSYEIAPRRGKIRSIGSVMLDYNDGIDQVLLGKVKSIGNAGVQFYSSFDNETYRGKLKAIGNTRINYYSNFDDKAFAGKVKSIGPANYTWYSSLDRREYQGVLKSGLQRAEVDRLIFIVW